MSAVATVRTPARLALVDAHEGPVYAADEHALYFTTLPRDLRVDIKRLDLDTGEIAVIRADANMANGMTLAPDGRLLVCEQGTFEQTARISAVDRFTGATETVVDGPLNSPNDVVVRSDGTIWFTDPSYGYLQGFRPPPACGDSVYRFDPATSDLSVVVSDFDKPNGLAFSPDETVLYVGDSGANHHIRVFDVDGEQLVNDRVLAVTTPGFPDGIKVDADGRVYASAFSGVQIFDLSGGLLEELALPGAVNFAFGGRDHDVLYITTDSAVWAAILNRKGA